MATGFGPIPGGGPPTPVTTPQGGGGLDSLFGGGASASGPSQAAAMMARLRDVQTQLLALATDIPPLAPFVQRANDALTEGMVQVGASMPEQTPGMQPPTGDSMGAF